MLNFIKKSYLLNDYDEQIQYNWQAYEDQSENIIKRTADSIRSLKENHLSSKTNLLFTPQYKEHLENMIYLLDKYLKGILKFLLSIQQ